MVHSLDWGVLSTISSRLDGGGTTPIPFGNVYSFVDGPCQNGTGVPYMYGTYLDQSLMDSRDNPMVSLTLTEASVASVCAQRDRIPSCTLGTKYGDPENPVCARLTVTGTLVVLDESTEEYRFAKAALLERHTTMEKWPADHHWIIAKIDIQDVWLIDYFGGATILTPETYFAVPNGEEDEEEESGN